MRFNILASVTMIAIIFLLSNCSTRETLGTDSSTEPRLYPVKENSRWGYMDASGKIIVKPAYDYTWDFSEGLGRFKDKGKFGFMNAQGEVVIQPSFTYADDFKTEYTRVNTKDTIVTDIYYDGYNLFSNWTFMNKKGIVFSQSFAITDPVKGSFAAVKYSPEYDTPYSYASFVNGELTVSDRITEAIFTYNGHDLAPASDSETGKIGFIDKTEQWVLPATFDDIQPLSEGLAAAKKDNLYGYIDQKGNWVYQQVVPITNTYYYLGSDFKPFNKGLAAVRLTEDTYGYIGQDGKPAFKQRFKSATSFSDEGYAIVTTEAGTGLIDTKGKFVIKPHLDIVSAEKGIVIFRDKDGYGAKELSTLKDIVPPKHTEVTRVGELIRIREAGASFGYIDATGAFAISPQFNAGWDFKNGKAVVNLKENMVYIDKKGKVLGNVPEQELPYYDKNASAMYAYSDINGKYGFGKTGVEGMVIPSTFDFATDFEGNVARVNIGASMNEEIYAYVGGKWGLIDTKGNQILAPTYDVILPFNNNVAVYNSGGEANYTLCEGECEEYVYYTCHGGKWGLLSDKGVQITEAKYENIIPFGKNFLVLEEEKYGIVDAAGNTIYEPQLLLSIDPDESAILSLPSNNFIKASQNEKFGLIDPSGKWIIEPAYDDILHSYEDPSTPYADGAVLIKNGEHWGALDQSGKIIVEPGYEEMQLFYNGMAAVKVNGKWGFINKQNQMVIEPKYLRVRNFQGDVTMAEESETSGEAVINNKGEIIFAANPSVTIDYKGFENGLCIIHGSEEGSDAYGSCGVINSKGKVLFNKSALSEARIQPDGLLYVIKNGKWALSNHEGVMLTGFDFDFIEPYHGQQLIRCNIGGEPAYDDFGGSEEFYGGMWGLIDKSGKLRVPIKFAEISAFSEGLAAARSGEDLDQIGYVDLSGKLIRPEKK